MNSDQLAADVVEVLEQERDRYKALLVEAREALRGAQAAFAVLNMPDTAKALKPILNKLKDIK